MRGSQTQPIGIFLIAFALLAIPSGQPLLDHYVGRQIPTAMVARNLARGSGFFRPQLDTGPFPNLFLVEPPVYAAIVAVCHRASGWDLSFCGRLVSALAMAAATASLFGLVKRRDGLETAMASSFCFVFLPIVARYGPAFQPDALMMGLVIAGMRVWDTYEAEGGRWRPIVAWILIAMGLATRILGAYLLVPLVFGIFRKRSPSRMLGLISTLLLALFWYGYAASMIRAGGGSRASADNAGHWLDALSLAALGSRQTYLMAAKVLFWRSFTPVGVVLAIWGLMPRSWWGMTIPTPVADRLDSPGRDGGDRLWWIWAGAAATSLLLLAGKSHHEYYWLALAPVVAVGAVKGATRALVACVVWKKGDSTFATLEKPDLDELRSKLRLAPIVLVTGLALVIGQEDLRTPPEWTSWREAVAAIDHEVPPLSLLAAPEALLYLADRKGCRLEYEPRSAVRAAGEWNGRIDPDDPLALVEFYRSKGARFVADLWAVADEPDRRALHDAIRRRYNVKVDRDGVILAEMIAKPAR